MKRTGHVTQEKSNRHQVEKYPKCTRNVVVRRSVLPVVVLNWYFTDRGPVERSQRRDEPVHFAIERQLPEQVAPVCFEGRAEIVNVDAAELGHQPIGAAGRYLSEQQI